MKTILIIDDEVMIREIIAIHVREMMIRPIVAESGIEALEIVKTETPEIVFVDLTLPMGLSGVDLVGPLKKILPDSIFIAMSGYSDHDVMLNPQAYGFHNRLLKPFSRQELKNIIYQSI